MLKLVILGIWVAIVTAGSTLLSKVYLSQPASTDGEAPSIELDNLTTEMTSVPVLRDGGVVGYVILQLNFAVDKELAARSHMEPQPYVVDAAFRAILQNTEADFSRLRSSDLNKLTEEIQTEANRQLGSNIVHAVLLQQLNYVRKEDIRTNWVKNGN